MLGCMALMVPASTSSLVSYLHGLHPSRLPGLCRHRAVYCMHMLNCRMINVRRQMKDLAVIV